MKNINLKVDNWKKEIKLGLWRKDPRPIYHSGTLRQLQIVTKNGKMLLICQKTKL